MIGEIIKNYRIKKKMTQEELANILGVTNSLISKYEKNIAKPSYNCLIELIKVLDIKDNELKDLLRNK